ncbi:cysteine hydrolase family protein [Alteromonas sp. ASW11-130]|uniref:cysteine hydrolase family protein n=1 Tax=Alteromonas sp. ASW11-130 TaxID=3015775 RepID=UPI002242A866|nr:isochorismatase family cysteine hydrolase [Alteromonas sp. ASW11-130]MCW8092344.1 cysteine hydrolase [Alteromonas sp. ASW11-130]
MNKPADFPDKSRLVLIIIDMINDLEFDDGEQMLQPAIEAARHISTLKKRLAENGIPTIYVNDNFGKWRSDFRQLVAHSLEDNVRGKEVVEMLTPDEEDYFVIKTRHSGFYGTTLEILLEHLEADTLILAGITGDICVQFTAQDAYMRRFNLIIPPDLVVCKDDEIKNTALNQLTRTCKAEIPLSTNIELDDYL